MKRFISLALCILLAITLVACSGGDQPTTTAPNGGSNDTTTQPPAADAVTLKFATQHAMDHMAHASAEAIKAKVESETEGRIKIDIYPAQQLGDYQQIYEELMRGTIHIGHIAGNEQFDARTLANFMPYIAYDYSMLDKAFGPSSYLSGRFEEFQAEQGIKFLGFYIEGLAGTASKLEVKDPITFGADKGVLIRIPPMTLWSEAAQAFGYRVTSIPYTDVYSAVQTGVVDGWAGGTADVNYKQFRDVIKYFYQDNIAAEATQYLMHQGTFDSFSAEDQAILVDAFSEQVANSFKNTKEQDEGYLQQLRDAGIEVVTFTPEELEAAALKMREEVWPKLADTYSEDLVYGLMEALAE